MVGEVEILLVTSCYRKWDKLGPDGPLVSYKYNDHTLGTCIHVCQVKGKTPWKEASFEELWLCLQSDGLMFL